MAQPTNKDIVEKLDLIIHKLDILLVRKNTVIGSRKKGKRLFKKK